jgi:hypothetical protein
MGIVQGMIKQVEMATKAENIFRTSLREGQRIRTRALVEAKARARARCVADGGLTSTPSYRHLRPGSINNTEVNKFVTSATSPDIACLSVLSCKESRRTKWTSKIFGG